MPPTPEQLTDADLKNMTAQQIVQAREDGKLNQLLGIPVPGDVPDTGQLTREHLQHMTPQQIVDAQQASRLDQLLASDD